MPRSSGRRKGSRSSASSRSDTIRNNVANSVGLSSVSRTIEGLTGNSSSCQVIFDLYEECMKTAPQYGASACDPYKQMVASCTGNGFKRDPHRRSFVERHKQWEENTLRRANAAGFATLDEYFRAQHEKDPNMCRMSFNLYNECIRKKEDMCDLYRNNCKQFKR